MFIVCLATRNIASFWLPFINVEMSECATSGWGRLCVRGILEMAYSHQRHQWQPLPQWRIDIRQIYNKVFFFGSMLVHHMCVFLLMCYINFYFFVLPFFPLFFSFFRYVEQPLKSHIIYMFNKSIYCCKSKKLPIGFSHWHGMSSVRVLFSVLRRMASRTQPSVCVTTGNLVAASSCDTSPSLSMVTKDRASG